MQDTMRKIGGAAGVAFGALVAVPFVALGDAPEFVDDPEVITKFFADNSGTIVGGALAGLLAAFALVWFVAGLRDALDTGAESAGVTRVVVIGGTIAAASYALGSAVLAVGGLRVDEHGAVGAATSMINWDLFQIMYGAAAPIGLAALLGGVAVLALRTATVVPRWLAWISLPMAIVGLIPPLSWALTFGIAAWAIVVSVSLFRSGTPARIA